MRATAGFSLVEVVVALGLLGSVLIAISGLFLIGGRQIRSGRSHSAALAVGRDLLEEMASRPFHDLYRGFGLSGSAAAYRIDSRTDPLAAPWQQALDAALQAAHALIELESVGSGAAPPIEAAAAIRITVTVSWQEGPRVRSLRLATARM